MEGTLGRALFYAVIVMLCELRKKSCLQYM